MVKIMSVEIVIADKISEEWKSRIPLYYAGRQLRNEIKKYKYRHLSDKGISIRNEFYKFKQKHSVNEGKNIKKEFKQEQLRKEFDSYRDKQLIKTYVTDKRYDVYEKRIKKFHNIHKGERCFLIGTGPSINKTNIDLLKNEIIIGVNTLYGICDRHKLNLKYYAIADPVVWSKNYKNILSLNTILFVGFQAGKDYLSNKEEYKKYQNCEAIPIRQQERLRAVGWKNKDLTLGAPTCHSVIANMGLTIAYYMGFKEVYLIGVDCDYSGRMHFDEGKYKKIPYRPSLNWEKVFEESFEEYRIIKDAFEKDNRKIYNSTIGGKLEVFERKSLEEIF